MPPFRLAAAISLAATAVSAGDVPVLPAITVGVKTGQVGALVDPAAVALAAPSRGEGAGRGIAAAAGSPSAPAIATGLSPADRAGLAARIEAELARRRH